MSVFMLSKDVSHTPPVYIVYAIALVRNNVFKTILNPYILVYILAS